MKINILGKKYNVKWTDQPPMADKYDGLCRVREQTLYINPTIHSQQQASCLIHEIIHAVSAELNVGLSEKQTRRLEAGLYQVIANNPSLTKYIQEAK